MSLLTAQIRNPMHTTQQLMRMVNERAHELVLPFEVDSKRLLMAFAEVESGLGNFNFRYEPAYGLSGLYYRRSKDLKDLYQTYGPFVGMSFGPWQLMYIVAIENGYPRNSSPLDLAHGDISLPYVIKFMNRCVARGAKTLKDLCSFYNGGNINAVKTNPDVQKYHLKIQAALDAWSKKTIDWTMPS